MFNLELYNDEVKSYKWVIVS